MPVGHKCIKTLKKHVITCIVFYMESAVLSLKADRPGEIKMSVTSFNPTLVVKFHRRRWRIMVGNSSLASFRSEEDALRDLREHRGFYEYWAGSASVQAENTDPIVIELKI